MAASKDEQLDKFIADLWIAITRIIKNTRHMGGRLAEEYDLTPPQIITLWQLKENGPMTMGELSELLSVTHGVTTRMVDRLLKKGMVERRGDVKDRRVVLISLTRLGLQVTGKVIEDAMSVIRGSFKNVPQRDREEFLTLLGRIEKAQIGGSGE
jgi:DNA-binding MarR family transcriptional regulator